MNMILANKQKKSRKQQNKAENCNANVGHYEKIVIETIKGDEQMAYLECFINYFMRII